MLALQELAGGRTDLVQLVDGDDLLMGGNLKNTIRRGVNDRVAGGQMLRA